MSIIYFILVLGITVFVHELGHFLTASILKVELDKIYIYPFGGISKFNIELNERLERELLILVLGPLSQFLFALILESLSFFSHYSKIIEIYNYTILGFNLLPIYPLDGGKLINILLSYISSFKRSLNITLIISYFVITIIGIKLLLSDFSLSIIMIICFLIYKVNIEWKNKKYLNDKFLLERYLHNYSFKKRKYVSSTDDMMRNKYHLFKIDGKYHTEREVLFNKFKNKY